MFPCQSPPYPGFTADQFGTKNNNVNYGIMFIGFAAAGYLGPVTMKNIYGQTGACKLAFLVAIAIGVLRLLLYLMIRRSHGRVSEKREDHS